MNLEPKIMNHCRNCREEFIGNYCPICGQRVIEKMSWGFVVSSTLDSFDFNKGLLFNLKQLTLHPVNTISDYLSGVTKQYLNPITYNFTGISLLFISVQLLGKRQESDVFKIEILVYAMTILFPFIFGLILKGSSINKKNNYLDGLIYSLFLSGHVLIVFVILRFTLFFINKIVPINPIIFLKSFTLTAVIYAIVISTGYLKCNFIKSFLRLMLSTLGFFIVCFILGVIFILFLANFFPETVNLMAEKKGQPLGYKLGAEFGRILRLLFSV